MAEPRRPRAWNWGLLAVILVGAPGWLAWTWMDGDAARQEKVMGTILIVLATLLALIVWLTLLSGLRWKLRVLGLMIMGVLGLGLIFSLRIEGVSGDLVPIVTWRWTAVPDRDLAAPIAAPPAERETLDGLADYPQFLGPDRDGMLPGPALQSDWSQHPPVERWRQAIGAGWSAFAVAGNIAVTQEQRGPEELVTAYDPASGALLWSHADETRYDNAVAGVGPRATPTVDADRVYTVGSTGRLNCLDLETGARRWHRDILADAGARLPDWGVSTSPLVVDGRVYVTGGGPRGDSLLAYDAADGTLLWTAGEHEPSYSSPAFGTLAGVPQVIVLNHATATGHDPASGDILWEAPWPGENPKVAQPVITAADRFLLSSGYGAGAGLFSVTADDAGGFAVERLWKSLRMKAKFSNILTRDGYAYGLDDGVLACIAIDTGKRQWKDGDYGHGQILLVDDIIIVQTEAGEIALVGAQPEAFTELTRYPVLEGRSWNNPTLAGRYLLVRNDREAVCLELAVDG